MGVIKKSSKMKKIALGIGTIPIICLAIITFWYEIAVPSFNNNQMKDFSGTYKSFKSENELEFNKTKLILLADGTYKFEGKGEIKLKKEGTWRTGGIDGYFEFYDNDKNLLEFASPFGEDGNRKIVFNFYDLNELEFIKVQTE